MGEDGGKEGVGLEAKGRKMVYGMVGNRGLHLPAGRPWGFSRSSGHGRKRSAVDRTGFKGYDSFTRLYV